LETRFCSTGQVQGASGAQMDFRRGFAKHGFDTVQVFTGDRKPIKTTCG
jgi:hypothetical protein